MEITFWGTRGSISSPGPDTLIYGGNTTCVEVTTVSGRTVVIDSGTGIRRLGDSLISQGKSLNFHLLMTHIHWDHLAGFPFFSPLFHENSHIIVDGWHRSIQGLKHVFSSDYLDGTWPVKFDDLKARFEHRRDLHDGRMVIGDTVVEAHSLQHPQGGLGFKFIEDTGTFVFLTDNELLDDGWNGTCFKDFVRFCRGADLLVHDTQYLPEDLEIRRGWGHSDLVSVARLAREAEVRRLVLFHHDPWRKDQDISKMVEQCGEILVKSGVTVPVSGAREGVTLTV